MAGKSVDVVGDAAKAVGEGAVLMLHGQRVLPQRLTEAGFSFRHPRLEGALKDLLA